jgi:hypothetical protein
MSMAWTYPAPSVYFSPEFGQVHPGRLISRLAENRYLFFSREVRGEEVKHDGEPFEEKMPRLVAELNAQFAESTKLEKLIKKNLEGLGYGF